MTTIDDEIKKAEAAHAKRMAALRAKAAREEARIREVMLDVLAETDKGMFEQLRRDAIAKIDQDKKQRSAAAKAAKAAPASSIGYDEPAASVHEQHLRSA